MTSGCGLYGTTAETGSHHYSRQQPVQIAFVSNDDFRLD